MALKAQNTISGKEGRLFLDGEEMAHIKTFEDNRGKWNRDRDVLQSHIKIRAIDDGLCQKRQRSLFHTPSRAG